MEKVLFSWSGGKDSALALHELFTEGRWNVVGLLTTLTGRKTVPMHEVSEELMRRQVKAIGIPLSPVFLPDGVDNETYESCLQETLMKFKEQGVVKVAHGDIFLEDVKQYRDQQLAKINMEGIYPLWEKDSAKLAERFIFSGFRSVITCVDTTQLEGNFIGRKFDRAFLNDLPANVDPCGENGEFHTFVYDGPIFREFIKHEQAGTYTTGDGRFVHMHLK